MSDFDGYDDDDLKELFEQRLAEWQRLRALKHDHDAAFQALLFVQAEALDRGLLARPYVYFGPRPSRKDLQ